MVKQQGLFGTLLYEKHKTLDEMLQEWQGAGQFIIVMDTWFEKLMAE